jgi:probable rRNA maturation factor
MLEVEVFGASLAPREPSPLEIRRLCARAAASRGVVRAHVAIEFVDPERIAQLNAEHRGIGAPTDVLSFPIDGVEPALTPPPGRAVVAGAPSARAPAPASASGPPRELGDVVICPEHTADVREAIVHGMLHLLGMDHEHDDGQMLALQRELLAEGQGDA